MAQQFQGKDFWSDIFDETSTSPFSQNNDNEHERQSTNRPNESPTPPHPAIDLYQTPSEWLIIVDLPGIKKSDIHLTLVRSTLTVTGEVRTLFPDAETVHMERLNGHFERTINLPENIEGVTPIAKFQDGLLIVRIQRQEAKAYQIDIE